MIKYESMYRKEKIMKFAAVLLLSLLLNFAALAGESFVEGMEDVPLPEGVTMLPNQDFSFGNDDTQLVEVYFQSESDFAKILKFYRESLPQLGWNKQSESDKIAVFERGAEELSVALESLKPLVVRLTLTGRPE